MGQSERDRIHNEEIMARERKRAADSRAKTDQFHRDMSNELSRQERANKSRSAGSGGGCLVPIIAVIGLGIAGRVIAEFIA